MDAAFWARMAGVALLAGAGCTGKLEPQSGAALEGFAYGWKGANHRLSHLQVQAGDNGADVAVIGGTSTTGQSRDLGPDCDPEGCSELPLSDTADVQVLWAELSSTETAIVRGSVDLEVGADGASGAVTAALPKGAPDVAVALISGLNLDTDHPLSGGDACYNPAFGWHPRHIRVALGEAAIDGNDLTVPVDAAFEAGESLEATRACVDAVNDQAIVALHVDVLFLVGTGETVALDLVQGAEFPFDGMPPDPQADPAPLVLDYGFEPTALGFSVLDYSFHVDDPDDRGAYLRTLAFDVKPGTLGTGEGNGTATNYSQLTQLSGFDYRFEGQMRAVAFPLEVKRGTATASLPADLDDLDRPIVTTLPYAE